MLPHNALVVVADGHSATLFRNTARHGIELREVDRVKPRNLSDESPGQQPSQTTPRDEDEATFARQLAERLNHMAVTNQVEDLVIFADPDTLGEMRKHYHKMLVMALRKEVPKTMTSATEAQIAAALG